MALGLGDGAEIRTPMAIAVISGLIVSTVLTLLRHPERLRDDRPRARGGARAVPGRASAAAEAGGCWSRERPRAASRRPLPRFSLDRRIAVLVLLASLRGGGGRGHPGHPARAHPERLHAALPGGERPLGRRPGPGGAGEDHPAPRGGAQHRARRRPAALLRHHRLRPRLHELQAAAPTWTWPTARCATGSSGRGPRFPEDVDRVYIRKEDASGIPVFVMGLAVDPDLADPYNLIQNEIVMRLERARRRGLGRGQRAPGEGDPHRAGPRAHRGQRPQHLPAGPGARRRQLHHGHAATCATATRKLLLRSVARYRDLEELREPPGRPRASASATSPTSATSRPSRSSGCGPTREPAVALVVFKEGQANTLDVAPRRCARRCERLEADPAPAADPSSCRSSTRARSSTSRSTPCSTAAGSAASSPRWCSSSSCAASA